MKNCDKFEIGIQALIAGDADFEQLEELVEHCKTCSDCRDLFEMHRTLAHLGSRFDELESVDLEGARRLVVEQVIAKSNHRPQPGWMRSLWAPLTMRPMAAIALVAVVFILGMLAFYFVDRSTPVAMDITDQAISSASLTDAENSPYSFSNLAVRYLDNNRLSLAFDITKHVAIVESTDSERVKKILMHAYTSSPTGAVGHFQTKSVKGKFFY
jgi:hypothetical protein